MIGKAPAEMISALTVLLDRRGSGRDGSAAGLAPVTVKQVAAVRCSLLCLRFIKIRCTQQCCSTAAAAERRRPGAGHRQTGRRGALLLTMCNPCDVAAYRTTPRLTNALRLP